MFNILFIPKTIFDQFWCLLLYTKINELSFKYVGIRFELIVAKSFLFCLFLSICQTRNFSEAAMLLRCDLKDKLILPTLRTLTVSETQ